MKNALTILVASVCAAVALADAFSLTPTMPSSADGQKIWLDRFDAKRRAATAGECPVVFVGDSLVQGWEKAGQEAWRRHFADGTHKGFNAGFSGDRTENVLWRIQHGMLDGLDPKAIVLMAGANNIVHRPPEQECAFDTFCGIQALAEDLTKRFPNAKIIIHPIGPLGAALNDPLRTRGDAVNLTLIEWIDRLRLEAKLANKEKPDAPDVPRILLCDFSDKLVGKDGALSPLLAPDPLHPSPAFYEIWADALTPYLDYALGKRSEMPRWERQYKCPTALPQKGPRAATARSQGYWLTGNKGKDMRVVKKVNEIADRAENLYDIVMLGDSVTHFWEKPAHLAHFKKTFKGYSVLNLAFGGHNTEHVLWNVTYGGFLDRFQARLFTLLIGTNNAHDSAEDTALGIRKILDALAAKQPNAKVILIPILPRHRLARKDRPEGYLPGSPERLRNEKVNELIRPFADGKRVFWCDFTDRIATRDAVPSEEILTDGAHPSDKGYDIWASAMMPLVKRILKK